MDHAESHAYQVDTEGMGKEPIVQVPPSQTNNPNKITSNRVYKRFCKDCGREFFSKARNTQYCKECLETRRGIQISKNTENRRRKIGRTKNRIAAGVQVQVGDTQISLPNDYLLNAEGLLASYLGISYGKFTQWKEKEKGTYEKWLAAIAVDFLNQSKTKSNRKEPRSPSKHIFDEFKQRKAR